MYVTPVFSLVLVVSEATKWTFTDQLSRHAKTMLVYVNSYTM